MALKGTLKDFSVGDIFQLIGHQQKSGSLFIRYKEHEAHVVFDKGNVVLGTFRKSHEGLLLGTMLLRGGAITSEQLSDALNTQKSTRRSVGDILKSMGAISAGVLSEFVSLQLKEVLFILFQWKDGFYEFVPGNFQYNKKFIRAERAESVLMDGYRMLDEWPRIIEKLESLERTFRSKVDLESLGGREEKAEISVDDALDDMFSMSDDDEPNDSKEDDQDGITDIERKILSLHDGQKSLQEVIYLSRMGTFEASRVTFELLNKGMIEVVEEFGQTRMAPASAFQKEPSLGDWMAASIKPLLVLFVICLTLPLIAYGVQSHFKVRSFENRFEKSYEVNLTLGNIKKENERELIQQAIQVYKLEQGAYPSMLEDLQLQFSPDEWDYVLEADGYILKEVPSGT